jgi:branched-chain amino acid transport system permease protein
VIGGITYLEGAWLGAFVFVVANNYMRSLPLVDRVGITEARFNTVVGVLVLIIVVASPNGLMGMITGTADRLRTGRPRLGAGPRLSTTTMEET